LSTRGIPVLYVAAAFKINMNVLRRLASNPAMEHELIRDMARVERPRERLEKCGADALRDAELLAIVLRTGYRGRGALNVAEDLLAQYPLPELLTLALPRMKALRGMGLSRAATLIAAAELVRRTEKKPRADLPVIQSMNDIVTQAVELRDKKKEHLMAFFMNARQQLIAKEIISIGTLTASLAHPREIFTPAIGKAAAGVILVHNHPSGDPSPSDEDARLTKRIAQAGHIMGIELLDHMIIAENGCYSFKTAGQL
jgi:DNA repair protein RadC